MDLQQLCLQSQEIIKKVGQFLTQELGQVGTKQIETKQLNHLVSYVDKSAEKQLVEALGALLPSSVFLAEEAHSENMDTASTAEWCWIIDPLDGTTNFLHQLPFFAISVALQRNAKTVMGIVYEPSHDDMFYAWEDGGAFLNGNKIQVSATTDLKSSLLATGFPYYDFEHSDAYSKLLKELMLKTRGIRRIGSAALDLVYVAAGRFDTYYEYSLSPWDVAAGALIVQEAGGKVSDFEGGDDYLYGREIIAGNPAIFEEVLERIKHHFTKKS